MNIKSGILNIIDTDSKSYFLLKTDNKTLKLIGKTPYVETKCIAFNAEDKNYLIVITRFNKNNSLIYYGVFDYSDMNTKMKFDKFIFDNHINFCVCSKLNKYAFKTKNTIKSFLASYNKNIINTRWSNEDLDIFLYNINEPNVITKLFVTA